jgi:hypothetical protein
MEYNNDNLSTSNLYANRCCRIEQLAEHKGFYNLDKGLEEHYKLHNYRIGLLNHTTQNNLNIGLLNTLQSAGIDK